MVIKHAEARQTGTLHKMEGLPCQDAVGFYENEDVAVIVTADGAGSVPHSEIASETIASQMPRFIADNFNALFDADDETLKNNIIKAANDFVNQANPEMQAYCTFLCAAVHKKSRKSILMHIGDGMILGIDKEDDPWINESVCYPENGEESNITYFLNGANASMHFRVSRQQEDTNRMYLLCSDGVSSSLYDFKEKRAANALNVFYKWIQQHDESISYMIERELNELFRNNSYDDMSIAVIYKDSNVDVK